MFRPLATVPPTTVLEPDRPDSWSYWATLGWTVLAFAVSAGVASACYLLWFNGDLGQSLHTPYDGVLVAIGTIASVPVQIAVLALAVRRKHWPVAEYFGLIVPRRRAIVLAVALLCALVFVVEGLLLLSGQELVTSFQIDSYRTAKAAGWLPSLFVAVVLFAPVGEEIMFRGFLYRGFVRRPGQEPYAIVIITAAWMMLHVQYDWVGLLQVFIIGLLLGWIRWTTGSTALTILLHVLMNFEAMIETVIKVEWLGP